MQTVGKLLRRDVIKLLQSLLFRYNQSLLLS